MKNARLILTSVSSLFVFLQYAFGQINLQCSGNDQHSIYLNTSDAFYRIDSVDTNPTSPIWLADNAMNIGGIAICKNLDLKNWQETMYYTDHSGYYYFWDGDHWINTFHSSGSTGAINPGGNSEYIFNLDGNGNALYRYDGTGNDILLLSNLSTFSKAIYDVATDNQGNFYLFYTNNQKIQAFNPLGILIDSFTTSGFPAASGPGFAILGDRMYAVSNADNGLYEGIETGSNINFTLKDTLSIIVSDIAACPQAGNSLLPHFLIYPNPAIDIATIKLYNISTLEIYDCLGRKRMNVYTEGLSEYHLRVSGLAAGVYFIKAWSENKVLGSAAFVVQ